MATTNSHGSLGATLGRIAFLVVALLLLNELVQYSLAWSRIFLAARDTRTAVSEITRTDPANRDAAAGATVAACAARGVSVTAYGHDLTATSLGQRVNVRADLETAVKYALIAATVEAIVSDGTPLTALSHRPMVRFSYTEQLLAYQ